jgi:hypothetical protein
MSYWELGHLSVIVKNRFWTLLDSCLDSPESVVFAWEAIVFAWVGLGVAAGEAGMLGLVAVCAGLSKAAGGGFPDQSLFQHCSHLRCLLLLCLLLL